MTFKQMMETHLLLGKAGTMEKIISRRKDNLQRLNKDHISRANKKVKIELNFKMIL